MLDPCTQHQPGPVRDHEKEPGRYTFSAPPPPPYRVETRTERASEAEGRQAAWRPCWCNSDYRSSSKARGVCSLFWPVYLRSSPAFTAPGFTHPSSREGVPEHSRVPQLRRSGPPKDHVSEPFRRASPNVQHGQRPERKHRRPRRRPARGVPLPAVCFDVFFLDGICFGISISVSSW